MSAEAGKPSTLLEQALRESESRFRALSEATREGIVIHVGGQVRVVNQALADMFGYEPSEMIGMSVLDLVPQEGLAVAQERLRTGSEERSQVSSVRKDGTRFPVEFLARNVTYEGKPARVASVRDLSEREEAQAALERSERRFRAMIEQSSDSVILLDDTGRVTYQSPQAGRVFGYTAEEAEGLLGLERVHPDDFERVGTMFAELVGSEGATASSELRVRHGDGSWRWVDAVATNMLHDPAIGAIVVSARDVTDRRAADEALRQAEERYRMLVESIPAVLYLDNFDPSSTSIYVSPQAEAVFGYPMQRWQADPLFWLTLVHPDDREWVVAKQAELVSERSSPFSMEYRMVAEDGRVVWVHDQGVAVHNAAGEPTYWQGFWVDITAAKEAQARVRAAEERYRIVVENARDLISLTNLESTFLYVSPSHLEVLGYAPEELVGTYGMALSHPDDVQLARTLLADISSGAPVDIPEVRLRHKSGRWVHVEGAARMVTDPDGNSVILATTRDITEHRRAEAERRRLLGRLVTAQEQERTRIADDIHDDPIQVMTAAGMRLSMLKSKLDDSPEREEVGKLEEVVERAIGRLRHLLFELHPPALDREGLGGAIGDYLRALIDEMGMDFVFNVEDKLSEEPPPDIRVVCYRIVQEALVNIRKHAAASRVVVTLDTIEGGTRVRVDDDGTGVPIDLRPSPGHLGLGGMRERAELAGGWFRIGPRDGGGTTVEFWAPNEAAETEG